MARPFGPSGGKALTTRLRRVGIPQDLHQRGQFAELTLLGRVDMFGAFSQENVTAIGSADPGGDAGRSASPHGRGCIPAATAGESTYHSSS